MKRSMIALLVLCGAAGAMADTLQGINIDFVGIGNAGNAADTTGYGAVGYNFRIGTYEVTIAQFSAAVAGDSNVGNGNEGYWNDGTRTVGTDAPASYVSADEAMKFCNYLTTGNAYSGAYQFDAGGTLTAVDRDAAVSSYGTVYVLPTEDEWYKAAYYKPVNDGSYSLYADGSGTVPTHGTTDGWNYSKDGVYVNASPNFTWETGFGGEEQNGTYDMMGNVWEWNESAYDGTLDSMFESRVIRGGACSYDEYILRSSGRYYSYYPTDEIYDIGFRVAAIPEPSSIALIGLFVGGVLVVRRVFML